MAGQNTAAFGIYRDGEAWSASYLAPRRELGEVVADHLHIDLTA